MSKWTELCSHGLWYQQNHLIESWLFNWSLHISNMTSLLTSQLLLQREALMARNAFLTFFIWSKSVQELNCFRWHFTGRATRQVPLPLLDSNERAEKRDKHIWIYNVQPFELGRDEGYFQIKHACILTAYIHSFQAVPLLSTFTEQALMLPKAAASVHLTQGQRHAGLVIW